MKLPLDLLEGTVCVFEKSRVFLSFRQIHWFLWVQSQLGLPKSFNGHA
jgi:hypothetical protein